MKPHDIIRSQAPPVGLDTEATDLPRAEILPADTRAVALRGAFHADTRGLLDDARRKSAAFNAFDPVPGRAWRDGIGRVARHLSGAQALPVLSDCAAQDQMAIVDARDTLRATTLGRCTSGREAMDAPATVDAAA